MCQFLAIHARWRRHPSKLIVWLFAATALLSVSDRVAAADEEPLDASLSVLSSSEAEAEQDGPRPLLFELPADKALTPADLPPPNLFTNGYLGATSAAFSRNWRAGSAEYRAIVERASAAHGLPPALLDAVMAVESRYNPAAVGMDGEIGLMQVMPATARMLGFTGTHAQLADTETNINYGAKYLAGAWRLARQDICTAAMKYRAGHGQTRFSYLSVDYCVRIRNHLTARGVVVTGSVPQPTFGAPGGATKRGRAISGRGGEGNLAALNGRLRALTDKIAPRNSR